MIYLGVIAYALLTLAVVWSAGRMLARFDETRGAAIAVFVIGFWPIILAAGVIAFAVSPKLRTFAWELVRVDQAERGNT